MHDYLKMILQNTEKAIAALKQNPVKNNKSRPYPMKSLKKALSGKKLGIIGEIKRASPSKGNLIENLDIAQQIKNYILGPVSAVSVLTCPTGFKGSVHDLETVSHLLQHTDIPVLRKDFIIDAVQIQESIQYGADALLLIVGITGEKTQTLLNICKTEGIEALVEVHNAKEVDYAVKIGAEMIGINNRNLTTFFVDNTLALQLKTRIPSGIITVGESGIQDTATAKNYHAAGFNALLIGEALVKSKNPAQLIQDMQA